MKLLSKIEMAFRHEPCCILLTNLFNWLIMIKLGVKYGPLEYAETNFYTLVIHLKYCTSFLGSIINRLRRKCNPLEKEECFITKYKGSIISFGI
jgi:hypothetical protein